MRGWLVVFKFWDVNGLSLAYVRRPGYTELVSWLTDRQDTASLNRAFPAVHACQGSAADWDQNSHSSIAQQSPA